MTFKLWGSVALLFFSSSVFAQQDSTAKTVNHYLGVQANQLIKQLFNLSNSTSTVNNPYLLVYSCNSITTGWGLNVGFGYTYNELNNLDGLETKINNLFLRAGVEKKVNLGKKWILSGGFDMTVDNQKNSSKNNNNGNIFETETTSKGWGFGPRATLNYKITNRILLATECTYYFRAGKNSTKLTTPFDAPQETLTKSKQFLFTVPAVLIMIVKF
ncbi:MAG: hypothetical protein ABI663_08815 [Chryseolinea sp.]